MQFHKIQFNLNVSRILKTELKQWKNLKKKLKGVTLSSPAVLELFLQTFDRFFLSRFILMSCFISYIFSQMTLLNLMKGFGLNAQEGYRSLFFKDTG